MAGSCANLGEFGVANENSSLFYMNRRKISVGQIEKVDKKKNDKTWGKNYLLNLIKTRKILCYNFDYLLEQYRR